MMKRREFIGQAGALALLGGAGPALAAQGKRAFGIQLWSVAKMLEADFEGTIALLAGLGYREVETTRAIRPVGRRSPPASAFRAAACLAVR